GRAHGLGPAGLLAAGVVGEAVAARQRAAGAAREGLGGQPAHAHIAAQGAVVAVGVKGAGRTVGRVVPERAVEPVVAGEDGARGPAGVDRLDQVAAGVVGVRLGAPVGVRDARLSPGHVVLDGRPGGAVRLRDLGRVADEVVRGICGRVDRVDRRGAAGVALLVGGPAHGVDERAELVAVGVDGQRLLVAGGVAGAGGAAGHRVAGAALVREGVGRAGPAA